MAEELREDIAWKALYKMVTFDHRRMDIEQLIYEYVDQILALVKEAGYVQLDPDQTLPQNPYPNQHITDVGLTTYQIDREQDAGRVGYAEAQQDMLKVDWRRTVK